MDLWSVGVCLFELYTGKFMFTGRNNNDMLKQFMDYKVASPFCLFFEAV
jgi:serine/threonine-protein kinase PRP4